MSKNQQLQSAKSIRNDEFYTRMEDVVLGLTDYTSHFKDKIVYCNCDAEWSNFWKYFYENFNTLGLKKLVATHYESNTPSYRLDYNGVSIVKRPLQGNGDFDSDECVAILDEADICATNPPFSLFPQFISVLLNSGKDFIVLGNKNAYTYTDIFPHIKSGKIKIGTANRSGGMWMIMPDDKNVESKHAKEVDGQKLVNVSGVRWFTTLNSANPIGILELTEHYSKDKHKTYDNYKAINVDKTCDIPCDYYGVMGVPISFLDKYFDQQFEIIGATESEGKGFSCGLWDTKSIKKQAVVDGNVKYKRVFIKRIVKEVKP